MLALQTKETKNVVNLLKPLIRKLDKLLPIKHVKSIENLSLKVDSNNSFCYGVKTLFNKIFFHFNFLNVFLKFSLRIQFRLNEPAEQADNRHGTKRK